MIIVKNLNNLDINKGPFLSNEKIKAAVENGNMTFLEAFQYPIWNKNVIFNANISFN
jgi:hypothetical protein